ncbi:MAG: type II secretion system F family protein [Oscillospiraceae bacterium]|nr:type II secretion system F family protein [Oscillospiraceae bacterium]
MSSENRSGKNTLDYADLGSFFENMGMMVRAGITVSEAVDLLREETSAEDGAIAAALNAMSEQMSFGSSLADAMRACGAFPDYAVDMTEASEYTGRLEDTLFHLSDYYRAENEMRSTLISAVRYPVILLFMVIAVLVAMLALVFPAFTGVYQNLTGSLSGASFNYIGVSLAVCWGMLGVMVVLVVLLLAGVLLWRGGKQERVRAWLSRIGTFRALFENLDLYRFTSCFDMFLSSGEMQDEALKKSMTVAQGEGLRAKLARCVEKMDAGMSFSQTAYEEKLYDPVNNRMLIPAERSGMLDSILRKVLGNLRTDNEKYIARIANTVEPLLTGLLMIFIGVMLISLMVPLIGIMNSIG